MAESNLLTDAEVKKRDRELVAGPGSIPDEGVAPKSLLDGASQYEFVDLLNPLSVEFIGMFGVERPSSAPVTVSAVQGRGVTKSEQDVRTNYGLDLRNPDHQGRANIVNRISIPSGRTVRLLGNEAQVVIKQLVNEIMSREDRKILLADPTARREVEERIVVFRGSVADYLGQAPKSVNDQLQEVKKEDVHEEQFPNLDDAGRVSDLPAASPGSDGSAGQPRIRIKGADSAAKPAQK